METADNNLKPVQAANEKLAAGGRPFWNLDPANPLNLPKKKRLAVIVGAGFLVALGIAVLALRHESRSKEPAETDVLAKALAGPRPVVLEPVVSAPPVEGRTFPGAVQAFEKTLLSFRVSGPLVEVNVKPGDAVRKGQVLMQVDPRDFQDRIAALEAQLDRTVAQYKKAAQDYKRATELFEEKVIPPASFDMAQSAHDATAAAVKEIEAGLLTAKHQLEDTTLVAPYDGIVTDKLVENHQMVAVGQVVVGLHDISRLKIEVEIPENEIVNRRLEAGEPAQIQFASVPGREFPAVLREWNTAAAAVTRTYSVVFEMAAPADATILPGMTAQARWASALTSAPVAVVSAKTVVADAQGRSFVWVFDPQTSRAQKREVETGLLMDSRRIQILKGVASGESIVRDGAGFITETMELKPRDSGSSAESAR